MALDLITTNAGRAEILRALEQQRTITVQDVQLSEVAQPISEATAELSSPVVTLTAGGVVRSTGSGAVLHVAVTDDGPLSYDLRALALRLTNGVVFMAYSQETPIARKAAESSLTFSLDLGIDDQAADVVVFGNTDFALPPATEERSGVVRLSTYDEASSLSGDSVLTPAKLGAALGARARHRLWIPPHQLGVGSPFAVHHEGDGVVVQRGAMNSPAAEIRWSLPHVHRGTEFDWLSQLRIRPAWHRQDHTLSFQLTAYLNVVRVDLDSLPSDGGLLTLQKDIAQSNPYQGGGAHRNEERTLFIAWPEGPHIVTAAGSDYVGLELVLAFTDVVFGPDHGPDTGLVGILGYGLGYSGPRTAPFTF
jgi:hypothetical protein